MKNREREIMLTRLKPIGFRKFLMEASNLLIDRAHASFHAELPTAITNQLIQMSSFGLDLAIRDQGSPGIPLSEIQNPSKSGMDFSREDRGCRGMGQASSHQNRPNDDIQSCFHGYLRRQERLRALYLGALKSESLVFIESVRRVHMGNLFSESLKQVRESLGYPSARKFFQFLEDRGGAGFNYSYYMRLEGARTLPSAKAAQKVASRLPEREATSLILAYCASIFPERSGLFERQIAALVPVPSRANALQASSTTLSRQDELSGRQIARIASDRQSYFVFLILTLAREPIELSELHAKFGNTVSEIIQGFLEVGLVRMLSLDKVESLSDEFRFPKAESPTLKEIYNRLDAWDYEFDGELGFNEEMAKMFLRRTSPRQFELIRKHCELIFDLIKTSEEVLPEHNNEVFSLRLKMTRGRLPG